MSGGPMSPAPPSLHYHSSIPGPPTARLNPGRPEAGSAPFAVVDLGESYVTFDTPEQAEAWAACTEAARLLREAGVS